MCRVRDFCLCRAHMTLHAISEMSAIARDRTYANGRKSQPRSLRSTTQAPPAAISLRQKLSR
jgi:hypothetical protein